MKSYLVEYICPKTTTILTTRISAHDKTEARDLFFESYSEVTEVVRITWVPSFE